MIVIIVIEEEIEGIDEVFGKRIRKGRMIGKKIVKDIMEIEKKRKIMEKKIKKIEDFRKGRRRLIKIKSDEKDLRKGKMKRGKM